MATNFYRGGFSEVRLWLRASCAAINVVKTGYDVNALFTSHSGTQQFTLLGSSVRAGYALTTDASAGTSTCVSYDPVTGIMVTDPWVGGAAPSSDAVHYIGWSVPAGSLDLTGDPGLTGAINGVVPDVYFGRGQRATTGPNWGVYPNPGEADKSWNAGYNMGLLTGFTTTNVTD